jgi:hypothetical protein
MLEGHRQDPRRGVDPAARVTDGDNATTSVPAAALWWTARCVACGAPSATQPKDPVPVPSADSPREGLPAEMPPLDLCDDHWAQYETDWFLLGWCVGHYAEALRHCQEHDRTVEPL